MSLELLYLGMLFPKYVVDFLNHASEMFTFQGPKQAESC